MPRSRLLAAPRDSRRLLAVLLAVLLAALVALQALTAALVGTLGPRHTHRSSSAFAARVVLDDFRRASGSTTRAFAPRHAATRLAHIHVDGAPARHVHAPGDASVVYADGEAIVADADEQSASAALAAIVTFAVSASRWLPPHRDHEAPRSAGWPVLTHDPEPLERPPRVA